MKIVKDKNHYLKLVSELDVLTWALTSLLVIPWFMFMTWMTHHYSLAENFWYNLVDAPLWSFIVLYIYQLCYYRKIKILDKQTTPR